MTPDNPIKVWVDEHRKLMVYAPIAVEADNHGVARFVSDGWPIPAHGSHAAAIVDTHNVTVPTALAMIEAVLAVHKPFRYYEHEDVCENNDEEHRAERHVEFEVGEYYCEDLPTGVVVCRSCRDSDGEFFEYPCETRQALEGVIDGE